MIFFILRLVFIFFSATFAVELRCDCLHQRQLIIGNPVRIRNCTRSCNFRNNPLVILATVIDDGKAPLEE